MNMHVLKNTLISALVISAFVLVNGCSKKTIDPPTVNPPASSLGDGTDINYPPADSPEYPDTETDREETLDDTSETTINQPKGSLSVNQGEIEGTVEFNKEHGRSSVGMSPIYYKFDSAAITPDMADRMSSNALYLNQLPGTSVLIEGNCDERGTNEYNLALGERRSLNAKEYLINLGVESSRIRTVGYGEERPLFLDPNDESHAQNRRADFILE